MRALIGCEFSGIVRDAFRARGHDAWSCDLLPSERPGPHIQGNVLDVLDDGWDLAIFHPPCTYLSRAGARWWRDLARQRLASEARDFVMALWNAPVPRVAIENPIGKLNQLWRYPDQAIDPSHFGERFTKRTCLWLRGLPPLMSTLTRPDAEPLLPSNVGWGRRKGQRSHPGYTHSARDASRTLPGLAEAFADQWGALPVDRAA